VAREALTEPSAPPSVWASALLAAVAEAVRRGTDAGG
jgi:tRNA U34 5-methylaminomethyl-2-thiouridine-forming methyltransferase MnmC